MSKPKDQFSWHRHRHLAKQDHEFSRRRLKKLRRGIHLRPAQHHLRPIEKPAPQIFSLIRNPVENVEFLNWVESIGRRRRIRILFDEVLEVTPDAAMALVATMAKLPGGMISGNRPKAGACRAILEESGFYDHVNHRFEVARSSNGRIARRVSNQVEGPIADDLIVLGTTALHGTPTASEASYRVLVEAMQNTRDHAHYDSQMKYRDTSGLEKETWWVMVHADTVRRRICFAFLDTGVGIFKSAKLKWWKKLGRSLRTTTDEEILREVLEGRLPSRTGLDHRGKGMPSMRELSLAGQIEKFTVVTNTVHVELDGEKYTSLEHSFHGTLIYWEIA